MGTNGSDSRASLMRMSEFLNAPGDAELQEKTRRSGFQILEMTMSCQRGAVSILDKLLPAPACGSETQEAKTEERKRGRFGNARWKHRGWFEYRLKYRLEYLLINQTGVADI